MQFQRPIRDFDLRRDVIANTHATMLITVVAPHQRAIESSCETKNAAVILKKKFALDFASKKSAVVSLLIAPKRILRVISQLFNATLCTSFAKLLDAFNSLRAGVSDF